MSPFESARITPTDKVKPEQLYIPRWRTIARWAGDDYVLAHERILCYRRIASWVLYALRHIYAQDILAERRPGEIPLCLHPAYDPTGVISEHLSLAPTSLDYMMRRATSLSVRQWWDVFRAGDPALGILHRLRLECEALFYAHVFERQGERRKEEGERKKEKGGRQHGFEAGASEHFVVNNIDTTIPDGASCSSPDHQIARSPDHPIPPRRRSVSMVNRQWSIVNWQSPIRNPQSPILNPPPPLARVNNL